MRVCIRLCALVCNVLQEDVPEIVADEDDSESLLNVLVSFLRKGFFSEEGEKEEENENESGGREKEKEIGSGKRHSAYLHDDALKALAWILFYGNNSQQIIDFLNSCAKYFVRAPEQDLDFLDKNVQVMNSALQCWSFLLTTLEEEDIHDLFTFK